MKKKGEVQQKQIKVIGCRAQEATFRDQAQTLNKQKLIMFRWERERYTHTHSYTQMHTVDTDTKERT